MMMMSMLTAGWNPFVNNDKSTKLLELYVQALAERIRSDKKLNVQFGED